MNAQLIFQLKKSLEFFNLERFHYPPKIIGTYYILEGFTINLLPDMLFPNHFNLLKLRNKFLV